MCIVYSEREWQCGHVMELEDAERLRVGWCTLASYNHASCDSSTACIFLDKYVHWQKCPEDHAAWVKDREKQIEADVYEQYTRAWEEGADVTKEVQDFDLGSWIWATFGNDESARRYPDPEAFFFDTYDESDVYVKFDVMLGEAYNDFHEKVERKILEARHAQDTLIQG